MFIPIEFRSVNKPEHLRETRLTGTSVYYQSKDGSADILFVEYYGANSGKLLACDILIKKDSGEVYAHDITLQPDDNWRNAYGETRRTLEALLPDLILTALEVKREFIEEFGTGVGDV